MVLKVFSVAYTVFTNCFSPAVIVPSGGYGPNDMAALGATLGVLLCGCLVALGFLLIHIRRDRRDWKKIYETNKFRSSVSFPVGRLWAVLSHVLDVQDHQKMNLPNCIQDDLFSSHMSPPQLSKGFGGEKEGIQYTNDAFSNDEDGSSTRSGSPNEGTVIALEQPRTTAQDLEKYLTPKEPLVPVQDNAAGSDGDDKEKEVRPILTKGRRQDEGYKSVWFKEDIDPEAKEEVVIIPDSRENDSDEEEQEQTDGNREESHRGTSETKRPKTGVVFKDEKPNSRGEDLQDDKVLTVDL